MVLLDQGKASQALAYLDKALEIDPEHAQALLNSAILLQEFGRPELRSIARERLLKLLSMDGKQTITIYLSLMKKKQERRLIHKRMKKLQSIVCE